MTILNGFNVRKRWPLLLRQPGDSWLVLAWYTTTYAFYRFIIGMGFDTQGLWRFMQFPQPDWLHDHLALSLWYLHSQPPLMSLLIGAVFKLCPGSYELAFEIIYFIAGMAGIGFLSHAMLRLGVSRLPRFIVCFIVCAFPTFYIYATWFYSTHLEFCLCAAAMYFLASFYAQDEHRIANLTGFFCTCCMLGLLRGQWHLMLFLDMAGGMALFETTAMRRQIALVSFLCLLPLAAWYAKNLLVFGFFGPSSWAGANLAQVTSEQMGIGNSEVDMLKADGQIADDYPATFTMDKILHRLPPAQIPARFAISDLAEPYRVHDDAREGNYNYLGVIASARQDMHDALVIIKRHPFHYARVVLRKMWKISLKPSCFYYDYGKSGLINIQALLPSIARNAMKFGAFVLYCAVPAFVLIRTIRTERQGRKKFTVSSFVLALSLMALSCAVNGGEQERMRWGFAPVYLCYAAMCLDMLKSSFGTRLRKKIAWRLSAIYNLRRRM